MNEAQTKRDTPTASTSASGSAAASADKWSDEGRKCLREALVATAEGKFGTAEHFRQCAKLAFESELELRKQQNNELCNAADKSGGAQQKESK